MTLLPLSLRTRRGGTRAGVTASKDDKIEGDSKSHDNHLIIKAKRETRRKIMSTRRRMLKGYIKRLIISNKEFILKEVLAAKGFMQLLMKPRNTGQKWTVEEKREVIIHLIKNIKDCPYRGYLLPSHGFIIFANFDRNAG